MLIKDSSGKILIPSHHTAEYIEMRMNSQGWEDDQTLAKEVGISTAEVSRIKSGERESLSPFTFYKLYKAFDDPIEAATAIVYPDLDLTLKEYSPKKRNKFGQYMSSFETIKNSIDIIADRTGISLARMKEMYFKTGAPDAYELLLIEKAIDKAPGEVFEELYGEKKTWEEKEN